MDAAVAISPPLPETIRGAARGRLEPMAAPVDVRLTPTFDWRLFIVECRRGAVDFDGEPEAGSRTRAAAATAPCLNAVAGGSGSGLDPDAAFMRAAFSAGESLAA